MNTASPNPSNHHADPLLTCDQAGEYLGVSGRFVYRQILAGHIAGHRLGPRTLRVRRSELDRYLDGKTVGAGS